jgi:hypothetical protein
MKTELTQDERRVKIAEACGWEKHPIPPKLNMGANCPEPKGWYFTHELPSYFTDLNACHSFEETLHRRTYDTPEWFNYMRLLERIAGTFKVIGADPDQRCEAFGKTKGLW